MVKKHLSALLILSIAIIAAYSNSLDGTWAMDDFVTGKPLSISDFSDLFGFRKVAYFTFFLNQLIAPFSSLHFRLVNILIHLLNTGLIYLISYKSVMRFSGCSGSQAMNQGVSERGTPQDHAFSAALLSAVLFGLHPININAVAYIVQRMASLAAFFVLLALLAYTAATDTTERMRSLLFYVLSGLLILAGIFSKENAVMAVPLILLYDFILLSRFRWNQFRNRLLVIGGIAFFVIGFSAITLKIYGTFLDIVKFVFSPQHVMAGKGWMAADVYWTPIEHVLTEFRVVSRYLLLITIPLPRLFVFDWWSFPISTSVTEPPTTLVSMILILSLVVISIWKMKRCPILCFGILWYFCAITLESFLALGSDLYFEHRNYLPVSGLFIGIAGQIAFSLRLNMRSKIALSGIIICGIGLGVLTFSRNAVWKDSITLWEDTVSKSPSNLRALLALGNAYTQLSDFSRAEKYYRDVLKMSARDKRLGFLDDAAYSLGMLYLFGGNVQAASDLIAQYEAVIDSERILILKGYLLSARNDFGGALAVYETAKHKAKGRDLAVLHSLMGDAYRKNGMWGEAIEQYRQAIEREPRFASAYYGMGLVFISRQDLSKAYAYFQKALEIDPDNVLALSDMADLLLIRKENPVDALRFAERAVSKYPPFYQPYLAMGNVLVVLGREEEADTYYELARRKGVKEYFVQFSKARAYYLRGDSEKAEEQIVKLRQIKDLPEQIRRLIEQ